MYGHAGAVLGDVVGITYEAGGPVHAENAVWQHSGAVHATVCAGFQEGPGFTGGLSGRKEVQGTQE